MISRPDDFMIPDRAIAKKTGLMLLEYYGIMDEKEKEQLFDEGFLLEVSLLAHELDWLKMLG